MGEQGKKLLKDTEKAKTKLHEREAMLLEDERKSDTQFNVGNRMLEDATRRLKEAIEAKVMVDGR